MRNVKDANSPNTCRVCGKDMVAHTYAAGDACLHFEKIGEDKVTISLPKTVWIVLWQECHDDPAVFVFATQVQAEAFVRATAQANASHEPESITEIVYDVAQTGWSLYIMYSQGDTLTVMRREVQGAP